MAEIPFETLLAALEATRGTGEAAPTHLLNLRGTLTPRKTTYRPNEARGTLFKNYTSVIVRKACELSADGEADANILPVLFNMVVDAVTSPTTPGGATNSRLWTFTRSGSADEIKAATLWWGDPNVQVFSSDFGVIDELSITNSAGDETVAMVSIKGMAGFPAKAADPSVPAAINGELLPGALMQLWMDTSSAIGTTAITGRVLDAEITIPTGATYKYYAGGPTASLDFSAIGRQETAARLKITLELPDCTEYDLWAAGTSTKTRLRMNGDLIESTFYNYLNFDIYGPLDNLEWGEYVGSNRTVSFEIESQYDATATADYIISVQNARASL